MRKILLAVLAVAAIVAAVIIGVTHRPAASGPTPAASSTTSPVDETTTPETNSGRGLQELLNTRLSTTGAQLSVGLPATVTIDTSSGETVYARVTMDELTQLPEDQARAVLEQRSSLAGYSTVWTMPVSLVVLGVVDEDGTGTSSIADLSAIDLSRFTIATHPGSDPLPASNTMTSTSCTGLDPHTSTTIDHTLTWCIHAFSTGPEEQPTGGQYETTTGTYQLPITWASTRYAAPEIP